MSTATDGTATSINREAPEYAANGEYAELKRLVKGAGLLEKRPRYYAGVGVFMLALLGTSVTLMAVVDVLWVQALNAAFMALIFTQVGFLGHDAGHMQIFRSTGKNDAVLLVCGLLIGLSRSWWVDKHNRHHSNPNDVDVDFDINIPIIAFTEEQAREKRGLARLIVKHQAFLFFPVLLLEAVSIRADSVQYLLRGKNVKYPLTESLAVAGHLALYFGAVFLLLSPMHAVAFIAVHQGLIGVYMGSVFAPNHKGMPVLRKAVRMDFLRRQVLTSRNVRGNVLIDFLYGGLNYQIEHHLFPSIPRNRLGEVRRIVKEFCRRRSIKYHETGLVRSYREILGHLAQVSATLRNTPGSPAPTSRLPQETV